MRDDLEKLEQSLARIESHSSSEGERRALEEFRSLWKDYVVDHDKSIELSRAKQFSEALEQMTASITQNRDHGWRMEQMAVQGAQAEALQRLVSFFRVGEESPRERGFLRTPGQDTAYTRYPQ